MLNNEKAFDDFLDDCFIGQDPICKASEEKILELIPSQLISEIIDEEYQSRLSA